MLLIALCAASCKTQRTSVQTSLAQQVSQKNDLSQSVSSQSATQVCTLSTDSGLTVTELEEVVVETVFSEPDSTGHQHAVKTTATTRRATTTHKADARMEVNTNSTDSLLITAYDNTRTEVTTNLQVTEDTFTRTRSPTWLIALIVGLIAAAMFLFLIFLHHYRII